jgi:hypothetical protein
MKVEIILDKDRVPVGYDIISETEEDDKTIAVMRSMHCFGLNETRIMYDEFDSHNPKVGNIDRLHFLQQRLLNK